MFLSLLMSYPVVSSGAWNKPTPSCHWFVAVCQTGLKSNRYSSKCTLMWIWPEWSGLCRHHPGSLCFLCPSTITTALKPILKYRCVKHTVCYPLSHVNVSRFEKERMNINSTTLNVWVSGPGVKFPFLHILSAKTEPLSQPQSCDNRQHLVCKSAKRNKKRCTSQLVAKISSMRWNVRICWLQQGQFVANRTIFWGTRLHNNLQHTVIKYVKESQSKCSL